VREKTALDPAITGGAGNVGHFAEKKNCGPAVFYSIRKIVAGSMRVARLAGK
jgi:hypothetical protein